MDPKLWRAAQRPGVLLSLSLEAIVGVPLVFPILYLLVNQLSSAKNTYYLQTILQIIAWSLLAYFISDKLIDAFKETLQKKGLFGRDLNKAGIQQDKKPVPEALGIVISIVFLVITIQQQVTMQFTQERLIEHNAGLLAICMVVLLGFVDDVVDLKWRHKLIVPTVASFPLLVAYKGVTSVVVPKPLRLMLGSYVDLGLLYYIYMGMISIFCTNAINIYAGINGIEVG
mmetsp:Transcript_1992/g.3508  ORF Transcript_1992/g.3508 Transcript_1992/m.3508 type:complete len:228 (+) Transcript_1992:218-901(+)